MQIKQVTLQQAQSCYPEAFNEWDHDMGPIEDACFYILPGEPDILGCDAEGFEPGHKHPHVWCPGSTAGAWDPL